MTGSKEQSKKTYKNSSNGYIKTKKPISLIHICRDAPNNDIDDNNLLKSFYLLEKSKIQTKQTYMNKSNMVWKKNHTHNMDKIDFGKFRGDFRKHALLERDALSKTVYKFE